HADRLSRGVDASAGDDPGARLARDNAGGERGAATEAVEGRLRSLGRGVIWLGGMRCGRTHSGMANWTAAKMARVTAMAGTARRTRTPAVTPSTKPNAAYPSGE